MSISSLARLRLLAIATVLTIGVTGNVHAQILAYKFVGGNPGYTLDTTNDSTGVITTTGWQDVSGTNQTVNALVDAGGNATLTSFTLSGAGSGWGAGVSAGGLTATQKLLGSWNEVDSNSMVLTFSNIPYAQYDIYIYGGRQAGDRSAPAWSVSDGTLTFSGSAQGPGGTIPTTFTSLAAGSGNTDFGDYAVFSGETSSSLTITLAGGLPGISGFEIVNTSPAPEPSTWLLMGLGFLGLFLFKRRNLISGR